MNLKFTNDDGYFEYEVMSAFAGTNDFLIVLKNVEEIHIFGLLQNDMYQFAIYPIEDRFDKLRMINMNVGEIYENSYIKVDIGDFVKENVIWPTYLNEKPTNTINK